MDDFIYEGESTPLLMQKRVVAGIVVAFIMLVAGYLVVSEYFGLSYRVDAQPLRDWVEDRGALGPIGFILLMAISVLFAPIPNAPIFIAAGLVWGPALGTAYSMAGMMLGSVMAFYVSRWFGRRHIHRLIGHKAADRLDGLVDTMGGRVIFWARMLPVVNFDWISFVAGLTTIRFWPFFAASFLGMLLPTTVAVVAGDALGKDVRVTLAMAGIWVGGIAGSAVFFYERRRRQRKRRAIALAASAAPPDEFRSS